MNVTQEQLEELQHVAFESECVTKQMLDNLRKILLMGHSTVVGEVAHIREYEQDWVGVRRYGSECFELLSYHAVKAIMPATKLDIADAVGWRPRWVHIVTHDGQLVRSCDVWLCELDEEMSAEFGENWPDNYWVLKALPSWVVVPKQPEPIEYDPFNKD